MKPTKKECIESFEAIVYFYKYFKLYPLPPREYIEEGNVGYWPDDFSSEEETMFYLINEECKDQEEAILRFLKTGKYPF